MSDFIPPQGLDKPWYGILPPQGAKAVAPPIPVPPPPPPPPPVYGMTIIKDVEVSGAAVSSIDLTDLDIGTHIQYLLLAKILNAYAGSNYLDLYVNGDTTRTNYYSQYLDQDGATRTKARENNPIIGKLDTSTEAFIVASIMRDPTGYPRILAKSNWKRSNTLMRSDRTVIKTATVANITQLTLTAEQANSIAIGSRVILLGYGTT